MGHINNYSTMTHVFCASCGLAAIMHSHSAVAWTIQGASAHKCSAGRFVARQPWGCAGHSGQHSACASLAYSHAEPEAAVLGEVVDLG